MAKCSYCGQNGSAAKPCQHCGAPIEARNESDYSFATPCLDITYPKMEGNFKNILHNRAFWVAVESVSAVMVMERIGIPKEIWLAAAALLSSMVAIFAIEDMT